LYLHEQVEADVPAHLDWLHPNEAARLESMRFPRRRHDWRLGRWTAKQALAHCWRLPVSPQSVEIRSAPGGAPEVWVSGKPEDVAISISHRAGRALCAVAPAGTALGCDLEWVEPHGEAFLADYFTEEEQHFARRADDRTGIETLLWSAKESALKALRQGLRLDTRCLSVRVTFSVGAWHRLTVIGAGRIFQGWWQIEDGWVRTLVSDPERDRPA